MKIICCRCKTEKPEEEYPWRSRDKGIRQSYCKECKKIYNRNWYSKEKNRQSQIDRATKNKRRYSDARLQWKIDYISAHGGCSYDGCDVTHPAMIDFDHIDGSDKASNVSQLMRAGASISSIEKEAAKCILLCANHHRLRTVEQFGWYSNMIY